MTTYTWINKDEKELKRVHKRECKHSREAAVNGTEQGTKTVTQELKTKKIVEGSLTTRKKTEVQKERLKSQRKEERAKSRGLTSPPPTLSLRQVNLSLLSGREKETCKNAYTEESKKTVFREVRESEEEPYGG